MAAEQQAPPMKWYDVTITAADIGYEQTWTLLAADESTARSGAMLACTAPLRGQRVDDDVREV